MKKNLKLFVIYGFLDFITCWNDPCRYGNCSFVNKNYMCFCNAVYAGKNCDGIFVISK